MTSLRASGSQDNSSPPPTDTAFVLVGRRPLPHANSEVYSPELPDTPHSSNSDEDDQFSLPPSSYVADVDRNNQILSPLPESPRSLPSPERQSTHARSLHSQNAVDAVNNSNHHGISRASNSPSDSNTRYSESPKSDSSGEVDITEYDGSETSYPPAYSKRNSNSPKSSSSVTPPSPAVTPTKRRSSRQSAQAPMYVNPHLYSKYVNARGFRDNQDLDTIIELQRQESKTTMSTLSDLSEEGQIMTADVAHREKASGIPTPTGNSYYPQFVPDNNNYDMPPPTGLEYEGLEDSEFPEVRGAVQNVDDYEMPVVTFRSVFIGIFLIAACSVANFIFYLHYPSAFVTPILIQLISYPIGNFCANYIPITWVELPDSVCKIFRLPIGYKLSLNPGPFNMKEHAVIVLMANASLGPARAVLSSLILSKYFNIGPSFWLDVCLLISVQVIGFAFAGLCRKLLVWPGYLTWPSALLTCSVLNAFHAGEVSPSQMSRYRFFLLVVTCAFFWYFFPGYLFTGLSAFSWVCWIFPNIPVVNQLFGIETGLGMGLLTFDWSQIAYVVSPLVMPWSAQVNVFACFVFFFWFLSAIFYYTNTWDFGYLPIWSSSSFDRYGQTFNVSQVIDSSYRLNLTAYEEYSPLYISSTFNMSYAIFLLSSTWVLVHFALLIKEEKALRDREEEKRRRGKEDVHRKLMRAYKEVPQWWYIVFGVLSTGLGVICVEVWDLGLPIWGLILSIGLAALYILPAGYILAISAIQYNDNLIVEFIPGLLYPGQVIPNLIFKSYGTQCLTSGLRFIEDLKLGHYMKIPPRTTFVLQIVSSIISCLVQAAVKIIVLRAIPDLCDDNQPNHFTCPQAATYFTSALVWGLIGPIRMFGPNSTYGPTLIWLAVGAILPFPLWWLRKRYSHKWPWISQINIPVGLTGLQYIPSVTALSYTSWFLVGFIFQYYLRRNKYNWWDRYNFIFSAGMDGGTTLCSLVIMACLQFPNGSGFPLNWWGNSVYTKTLDYKGNSFLTPPANGFGKKSW